MIEQDHTVRVCEDVRAKLALEVGAPAPYVAALVVDAGVVGPGRDAKGAHAVGQVHQAGEGAGVAGVTSELAVVVGAPAEHLTFGGDGARVALTGVEVHHDGAVWQIHAMCSIHADGAGRGGRGVAYLLLIVGAPTDDRRLGRIKCDVTGDGAAERVAQGDGTRATWMNLVVHPIDVVAQAVTVRVGRRGRRVMRIRAAGLLVDAEPAVTVEVHVHPNAAETVDADQPEVAVAGVANRRVQDAGRRPMQVNFLNAVRPQGVRRWYRTGSTHTRQHEAVARIVGEVVVLVEVHGHGHRGRVDAGQAGVHRPVGGRGARGPPVEAGADAGVTGRIGRGVARRRGHVPRVASCNKTRAVLMGDSCPIAQLPSPIRPPTLHGRIVKDGARVVTEDVDGDRGPTRTKVNRNRRGLIGGGGGSVAQLALAISAPALHGTVVEDGARVSIACGDGHGGAIRAKVNGER